MEEQLRNSNQVINEMRMTFDALRLVIRSAQHQHASDFAHPSPARTEWETCTQPLSLDLHDAYQAGALHWLSILDHGDGLSAAIHLGLTHSACTLGRSIAEGAARSWYLLEEGISPTERVRRHINDQLYAGHEDKLLLEAMLPSVITEPDVEAVALEMQEVTKSRIALVGKGQEKLEEAAQNYGFRLRTNRQKRPCVGEPRPSAQKVMGLATRSPAQVAWFYRSNSATAHFSQHAQKRMLGQYTRLDGLTESRPIAMNVDDLIPTTGLAVLLLGMTAAVLFRQAGWDMTGLDKALLNLRTAWNPPPDEALLAAYDEMKNNHG